MKREDVSIALEDRFWAKVSKTETCWIWTAAVGSHGYGQYGVVDGNSRVRTAHRFAFLLIHGREPGRLLMHECDNRRCVRPHPEHVVEGTQKQNIAHAMAIGSFIPPPKLYGSAHHATHLTEADAFEMRTLRHAGVRRAIIAERFGISESTAKKIISGETWPHVPFPEGLPARIFRGAAKT